MIRALRPTTSGAVLYVNVSGLTNVAVADARGCLFTRAASGGLDAIVNGLAERRGLTLEHARAWLGHVGLVADVADVEGDPAVVAATRAALEDGVHHLADTVRNSLNFYRMQDNAAKVEEALLTGPAVAIPGFAECLADQLKLPVAPMHAQGEAEGLDLPRLTVAAGLAVATVS
jgi:type IV pilus assembly protein PilM